MDIYDAATQAAAELAAELEAGTITETEYNQYIRDLDKEMYDLEH